MGLPASSIAQTNEEPPFPPDWWWGLGEETFTMPEPYPGFWSDWGEPAPAPPQLLTPFPVVRLSGVITARGTRVVRLTVQAPSDATVAVRCRGTSCPFDRSSRTSTGELLRIRRLERSLRPGTVIEVLVGAAERIGKYTRFVIRDRRRPTRTDLCLWPGASTGQPCPTS